MKSLLHITHGDTLTPRLQALNLNGDIITWREMLCEGKTLSSVGSESFWKTRFEFLNKSYKVSKDWFIEKTLKEYRSLCNHKQQNQIVLWFGRDLFSQINMLALLSWLKTHRKDAEISLVYGGKKERAKSSPLHELSDEKLLEFYEKRIILKQNDIEYADYVWQLYCSESPIRLENVITSSNIQFDYLSDALNTHLKRFPSIKNGLNELENRIIKTASTQKTTSHEELLKTLQKQQKDYGFSSLQYERIINSLKPLFQSFNPLKLTKKGQEILASQTNCYAQLRDPRAYLGGALKYNFLYNTDTDRILKL